MKEIETIVVPESPSYLGGQQTFVYVPIATNNIKGIASFSQEFKIVDGKVYLNYDLQSYVGKIKIFTIDSLTYILESNSYVLNFVLKGQDDYILDINDKLFVKIDLNTITNLDETFLTRLREYLNGSTYYSFTFSMTYKNATFKPNLPEDYHVDVGNNLRHIYNRVAHRSFVTPLNFVQFAFEGIYVSENEMLITQSNLEKYLTSQSANNTYVKQTYLQSNYYNKEDTDNKYAEKTNTYTKSDVDALLNGKASTTDLSTVSEKVTTLEGYIPVDVKEGTDSLATEGFVNSSIATNTANFIGTFNNITERDEYAGTITNNDYCFVTNSEIQYGLTDWPTKSDLDTWTSTHSSLLTNYDYAWVENGAKFDLYRWDLLLSTPDWVLVATNIDKADFTPRTAYNRYKYSNNSWLFEYTLNNSSFTAAQWAAINSGITDDKVNDMVNKSGNQSISGAKLFTNDVTLSQGKYIKSDNKNLIGKSTNGVEVGDSASETILKATSKVRPSSNNSIDLGDSTYKYKDLYLSGNLTDGSNSISISDIGHKSVNNNYTLYAANWSGHSYTLSVTGKTATNNARLNIPTIHDPNATDTDNQQATLSNMYALKVANIYYAVESGNNIILTCETVPSIDLVIQVEVF